MCKSKKALFLISTVLIGYVFKAHGAETCENNYIGAGWFFADRWDAFVGSEEGQTYLLADNFYKFSCCGVIERWMFNIKNTGTLRLHVWRKVVSTTKYRLVGENVFRYEDGDTGLKKETVKNTDRISVEKGDILGWYTEGKNMITYSDGLHNSVYHKATDEPKQGDKVDVTTFSNVSSRNYAIGVIVWSNSAPRYENVPTTYTIELPAAIGVTVTVLSATDNDPYDEPTLKFSMKATRYFRLRGKNVTVSSPLKPGSFTLTCSVSDHCGASASIKLIIIVQPEPTIKSSSMASRTTYPPSITFKQSTATRTTTEVFATTTVQTTHVTTEASTTTYAPTTTFKQSTAQLTTTKVLATTRKQTTQLTTKVPPIEQLSTKPTTTEAKHSKPTRGYSVTQTTTKYLKKNPYTTEKSTDLEETSVTVSKSILSNGNVTSSNTEATPAPLENNDAFFSKSYTTACIVILVLALIAVLLIGGVYAIVRYRPGNRKGLFSKIHPTVQTASTNDLNSEAKPSRSDSYSKPSTTTHDLPSDNSSNNELIEGDTSNGHYSKEIDRQQNPKENKEMLIDRATFWEEEDAFAKDISKKPLINNWTQDPFETTPSAKPYGTFKSDA